MLPKLVSKVGDPAILDTRRRFRTGMLRLGIGRRRRKLKDAKQIIVGVVLYYILACVRGCEEIESRSWHERGKSI